MRNADAFIPRATRAPASSVKRLGSYDTFDHSSFVVRRIRLLDRKKCHRHLRRTQAEGGKLRMQIIERGPGYVHGIVTVSRELNVHRTGIARRA